MVLPTRSAPASQAATPSSRVAQSAMMMMFGYFSRTRFRNSPGVRPSPRSLNVQSMDTMSASASMHSSTSRIVMVILPQ